MQTTDQMQKSLFSGNFKKLIFSFKSDMKILPREQKLIIINSVKRGKTILALNLTHLVKW